MYFLVLLVLETSISFIINPRIFADLESHAFHIFRSVCVFISVATPGRNYGGMTEGEG